MKKNNKIVSLFWILAIILEWVNVVLFMAARSYSINIPAFLALSSWKYIDELFYICATIDAIIFGLFAFKYRKEKKIKEMLISTMCSLMQLILIIYDLLSLMMFLM